MAFTAKLELRQSHSLVMTPQLQQAIKLLQLSNMELTAFVEAELERNPLLEREESDESASPLVADAPDSAANLFEAAAKGVIKIDVLAAGSQCRGNTLNVLAMPSSKITSPADLAGKSIAVNLTGNIQTLTINAVLKAKGVNPAGIKYVEIPFQDMTTALTAGRVDAISEVEPFITAAEHAGAKSVLAECQGSTAGIPLGGYYALQSWVQKNPKTAAAFRRAIDEAQVTANSDRKLVEQVLPTYTKITPAIAAQISLPYYPPTLDAAQLDRIVALMRSGGLLTGPFNLTPMLFQPSS